MKRIPQLHGLRGAAILGVLLFHLLPHYEAIAALFPRPLLSAIQPMVPREFDSVRDYRLCGDICGEYDFSEGELGVV